MNNSTGVTMPGFIKCIKCGELFNPAYLDKVIEHEHIEGLGLNETIKGKKVINHARDVYPYCSGEFASGVHVYLNGLSCPTRPCADEFIQGWMCAERDLKNNYALK